MQSILWDGYSPWELDMVSCRSDRSSFAAVPQVAALVEVFAQADLFASAL